MERMTPEEQEDANADVRKLDMMMLRFAVIAIGAAILIFWN